MERNFMVSSRQRHYGTIYQYVFGLTVLNNGTLCRRTISDCRGITANGIAKWDGNSWSALGNGLWYGGSNAYGAYAVTTFGDKLIVGGLFTTAGTTELRILHSGAHLFSVT
ncbi:MAG: hypothetical protein R3A12_09140 [Ignavibacteria bacterium]